MGQLKYRLAFLFLLAGCFAIAGAAVEQGEAPAPASQSSSAVESGLEGFDFLDMGNAFFDSIFSNGGFLKNFGFPNSEALFKVSHPEDNECVFLLEWKDGVKVNDTKVTIDIPSRMFTIHFHHESRNGSFYTSERSMHSEFISPACELSTKAVENELAGYALQGEQAEEGKGFTVKIWFPLATDDEEDEDSEDDEEKTTSDSQAEATEDDSVHKNDDGAVNSAYPSALRGYDFFLPNVYDNEAQELKCQNCEDF